MAWHKKSAGPSIHVKVPTPKVPTPKPPAAPKAAQTTKPVSAAKEAKLAKTGVYAAKKPHMGAKHGPVNKGHVH